MTSRLKSLELQGYKTFASKTNFEFPGKITAVVGPNGSGKSNIADAVRWVLGEQSFRLLRGRKTEDMIFAGSEGRSRAGMASSTITFNNEDGWLPIDYSEVTVTRRAYRDGQNEYLLNGQRIRLRDIQELLAQSGLAERTYTLIGQGLVDSALSIRPDERRKFFEEAAGIGLYRSRREESLNRLDQTRHNLERVTDILSELEPRLRSLERQSRRYLEYKTLQADLQVLLRIWYGYHWNNAQKDLTTTKQVLHEREVILGSAKEQYKKLDQNLMKIRSQISTKREELNYLHNESSTFHLELEKMMRDLAVLEERKRSLTDQEYHQNYDSMRLEEEIKSKEINLVSLEEDLKKLSNDVLEAKTNYKTSQSKLDERVSARNKVENELHNLRRNLVEEETKSVQSKAKLNELNDRINNYEQSLMKLNQEKIDVENEHDTKRNEFEETKKDLIKVENELADLINNLDKFENEKKKIENEIQIKNKNLQQIITEEIKTTAQLNAVEEAESSLSGYNQGAKNLINAAKNGTLTTKVKTLNEIIKVQKDMELPISAALGEFIDSILIQSQINSNEVIHFLSKEEQGRAILLPVDTVKDTVVAVNKKMDGFIGNAIDFLDFDNKYKSVIECLLGNTLVFDNQKNAIKAINGIPLAVRIVTLSGEIFQGNGVIIAGKETKSSILSRPRLKQEISDSLNIVRGKITGLQNEIETYEKKLVDLNTEDENLRFETKKVEQILGQKQKLFNQFNLDVEKLDQRRVWIINQIKTIENQLEQSSLLVESTKNLLAELEKRITTRRKEIENRKLDLNQLPLDDMQSEVGHWKTNYAVVERALNEAEKRYQENKANIDQDKRRFQSLSRRLEDFKNTSIEIDEEKAMMRVAEEDLQAKIENIREKIIPADVELKELEKKSDRYQEELNAVQQTVTNAERFVTQAQLDYSRNKDVLDNLRRRIEEDFGLVSFEYSSSISGPTPLPFDGLVENLPIVNEIEANLEENINRQRAQMRRIGPINPEAEEEYISVKERYEFLTAQVDDLKKADQDLRQVISELDELMQREFRKTFDAVAIEFKDLFTRLFGGGSAKLYLTDEDNFNNTGIEIEARLPGRREQGLSLLSGGERSLTAVALIFSLLRVSPTPFCVLDEVDAALDESNVGRFCDLLKELSETIQFIVITHNRNTVQVADVIYGITMGRDSASQTISLKLDEVSDELVK